MDRSLKGNGGDAVTSSQNGKRSGTSSLDELARRILGSAITAEIEEITVTEDMRSGTSDLDELAQRILGSAITAEIEEITVTVIVGDRKSWPPAAIIGLIAACITLLGATIVFLARVWPTG